MDSELQHEICTAISERFGVPVEKLLPEATMEALNIDSLSMIEFLFEMEDKMGISLADSREPLKTLGDVYNSMNQVYMAGLMTAPMVVIEMLLMSGMYTNRRLNAMLLAGGCVAGIALFLLIRQQVAISDRQFLRSMIPHHSGAILMCEGATLQDQRIKDLCKTIVAGQRSEIDQMRALLQERASAR